MSSLFALILIFGFTISWAQTSDRAPICTDSQINYEINVYFSEKVKARAGVIGNCLLTAIQRNLELDQIRGLRVQPELINEMDQVLRVAEELDRKKYGLKPGEKIGPEHIKAEISERGLDPDGNPL